MPFTFLAHQGPILPLARRWPRAIDGVTLVVGSMAPDMAYVLSGSRFQLWAHALPELIWFCVPVTLVVSWLIVRVLAPAVPPHLPNLGSFRLRELRGLSSHRFSVVPAVVGAALGAVSHVVLDSFTHDWGWFAKNVSWYDDRVIEGTWLGREWTVFRVVQYVGHVGGSALCVWLLWRYGRQQWMTERAREARHVSVTRTTQLLLWSGAALGSLVGVAWIVIDRAGIASDILRLAGCSFVGLCIGSLAVSRSAATA